MQPVAELKEKVNHLNEIVEFYENILDCLPALIYINQIEESGELSSFRNVWSNKRDLDFIGYNQEEIFKMGFEFAKLSIHPEDLNIIPKGIELHFGKKSDTFQTGFYRLKGRYQNDYNWFYGFSYNFKIHPNGIPKQSLNIVFEINTNINTEDQLISLFKEINCLKHKIKLKCLTRRENEILKLIEKGNTDKVISVRLNISIATAKTHRNRILKKLGLKNSAALAAFAAECGL